ncbi:hypothetical protein [Schlesneria paludicola]|uniref:hypothetical protein n=1 Tax=Schlesneria paludicola TaxID=360056 RepID=UPI00029B140D|nr:hypothetical protein [Schlesneria paludicola]
MFRREYYPSDTIKLINQSEGKLGVSGKAAHAIAEHLMKGSPGAVLWNNVTLDRQSVGISKDGFRDRFKESPGTANSGWLGKGDMTILLCELLNSDVGQEALGALDGGVKRVEIHYLNLKKLAKLFGGLADVNMNLSNWLVTPAREDMVDKTFTNGKGESITRKVKVKTAKVVTSVVKAVDLASVHAVLDVMGTRLHLQTLFPDNSTIESRANWTVGQVNVTVTINASGNPVKIVQART